jgi:signal peptidase I
MQWAVQVLGFGLAGREVVSIYKIPSLSMDPTIMPDDLVLTEKVGATLHGRSRHF